jgi:hypothetical protein
MSLQTLTLKLDGITAGDYLTWCHDPDPPALDYGLRSIRVDGDPLGDTITAILHWNQPEPAPRAAASAAGLSLPTSVQIHPLMATHGPKTHRTGPSRPDPQIIPRIGHPTDDTAAAGTQYRPQHEPEDTAEIPTVVPSLPESAVMTARSSSH